MGLGDQEGMLRGRRGDAEGGPCCAVSMEPLTRGVGGGRTKEKKKGWSKWHEDETRRETQ